MFRWGALAASLAIVTVAVYVGTTNKQPAVNPLTSDKAPLGAPALEQKVQRDDTATQLPSSPGLKAPQVRYEKMPTPPAATRSLSDQPKDKAQRSPAILAKADKLNEARAIGGLVTIAPGAINEPSTPSKAEASMRIDNLSANEAQADAKELRAQAPPPPPPPPVNGALMARTEAANSVSQSVQVSAEGGPVQDQRSLDAASGQFDKSTRAKVAPTFKTSASSALSGYQPFANLPGLRWHVTPEGRLQHADEKGNWNDQLPALRFTAVDTFGEHIWAFGPQLLLMHSSDNGLHWARVVPHTEDSSPQGDIISLNFTDQGHGSFKTSSGETWSTADSGKTWKKE